MTNLTVAHGVPGFTTTMASTGDTLVGFQPGLRFSITECLPGATDRNCALPSASLTTACAVESRLNEKTERAFWPSHVMPLACTSMQPDVAVEEMTVTVAVSVTPVCGNCAIAVSCVPCASACTNRAVTVTTELPLASSGGTVHCNCPFTNGTPLLADTNRSCGGNWKVTGVGAVAGVAVVLRTVTANCTLPPAWMTDDDGTFCSVMMAEAEDEEDEEGKEG